MNPERLMVFIDANNLLKSSQQFASDFKIDFIKLKGFLSGSRDLRRIYFFDAIPDKNDKTYNRKSNFLDFLRYQGYTVKCRPLKYRGHHFQNPYQKGVDVHIVCEMIRMAREDAYDVALLVSGDNDFTSAIELIQDLGKNVEVAGFQNSIGNDIKQVSNKLILLDHHRNSFGLIEESSENTPKPI